MALATPDRASPEPPPSDEGEVEDDGDEARPTRRRLLPAIVLVGAVVVGAPLLDGVGDRRELVIRLDDPAEVTAISVVLRDHDDAIWGTQRQYASGSAPAELRSRSLPLSPGRYQLVVSLVDNGQTRTIERGFDVADDASEVVVPVPPPSR